MKNFNYLFYIFLSILIANGFPKNFFVTGKKELSKINIQTIYVNDKPNKVEGLRTFCIVNIDKSYLNDKIVSSLSTILKNLIKENNNFQLYNKESNIQEKELKKYINGNLFGKKKNKFLKKIESDSIVIIIQLIFDENYLKLEILNKSKNLLATTVKNMNDKIKNIDSKVIQEYLKILFSELLNKYFYRTVQINNIDSLEEFEVFINGQKHTQNVEGNKILNIPRYDKVHIHFTTLDSISNPILLNKNIFNIHDRNKIATQQRKSNIINKLLPNFKRKGASVRIKLNDVNNIQIMDKQTNIGIFKRDKIFIKKYFGEKYLSDEINFNLNEVGNYLFILNTKGYSRNFRYINLVDSIQYGFNFKPPIFDGSIKSEYSFTLNRKSKPLTFLISSLLPGSGHFYQENSKILTGIIMLSYALTVYESIVNWNHFTENRDKYYYWSDQYNLLTNGIDPGPYFLEYEENAMVYFDKAQKYKEKWQWFRGGAIAINLTTNLHLKYLHDWK